MKTAALIIHYNRNDLTERVVGELVGVDPIIVLDNGSNPPFPMGYNTVLRLDQNVGFIKGVNIAMKSLTGLDAVWTLNNDISGVSPNMLAELSSELEKNPNLAAVSPAIIGNPHYQMNPHANYSGLTNVRWLDWPAPLVRVAAWKDVGGFDEELLGYGCDLEWCYRAREKGWTFGVRPNLAIKHQMGASVNEPGATPGHSDLEFMNSYLCEKYGISHWGQLK